jgi:hypothetical protein
VEVSNSRYSHSVLNGSAKRSAPRLLALTAVVLVLGFTGVEGSLVLCFGDDGHVSVETAGPKGCADLEETAEHGSTSIVIPASSSHCGSCVDVALASSSATASVKAAKRTSSSPAAIFFAELRPPVQNLRARISHQHAKRFISEKSHTVVIRC